MFKNLHLGGYLRFTPIGIFLLVFLFSVLPLILSSRASGMTTSAGFYQSAKLAAGDLEAGDAFSSSVAISGNTAIIGAPQDDDRGVDSGAVYVFTYDPGERAWTQVAKLHASDAGPYHQFGTSVAINGDIAFVGAPVHSPGGLVYIFERDLGGTEAWGEVRQIQGDEVTWNDYFGISMDISGDLLIVGAYAGGDYDGSAYIFERNQGGPNAWGQVARLVPEDNPAYNFFGYSVAISGETAMGGAPGYNYITGAAYIFERQAGGNWLEVAQLTPDDGNQQDFFGIAVDIDENICAAGSPANEGIGAVYVYERDLGGPNAWGLSTKLLASDGNLGDGFGQDVLVEQEKIFTGATGHQANAGAVYIYGRDPGEIWEELYQLIALEPTPGDGLGDALAMDDLTLLAGAVGSIPGGAAYVYTAYSPPAQISLSLSPNPAAEGEAVVLTGSFFDPDPDEDHALNVNWGDGDTNTMTVPLDTQAFTLTHVYADDFPSGTPADPYTLTVTITDAHEGIAWAQYPLVVENISPAIAESGDVHLHAGDNLEIWGSFTDPGLDTWTGSVDYGDGSETLPLELEGQTFHLEHSYPDGGEYRVTVIIADDDTGQDTSELMVSVSDHTYWHYLTLVRH